MVKCQKCNKREYQIKYSDEPVYALTHDIGITYLCRECYINLIEEKLKDINLNLKKQKDLLRKEKYKESG